jgi:integrase
MARPKRTVPWLQKRGEVYYAYWPIPGQSKPGRLSLRTKLAGEAEDRFAAFLITECREERSSAATLTCEMALTDYRNEHVANEVKDTDRVDYCIKNLMPHFGPVPVKDVTSAIWRNYIKRRTAGELGRPAGNGTIRRELAGLVAAFNHEVREKRLSADDVPHIKLPPAPEPRDRWLTKDEMSRLIDAAEGRTKLFIQTAYYTASRKTAIFKLKWFQIDLANRTINLLPKGEIQTRKRRPIVPIVAQLVPFLAEARAGAKTEFLLGHGGDLRKSLKSACDRAGISPAISPHVLRHTRAVHLAQDGVDLYVIAGLLGDKLETVAANYLHHCPGHLRDKLDAAGALTGS